MMRLFLTIHNAFTSVLFLYKQK